MKNESYEGTYICRISRVIDILSLLFCVTILFIKNPQNPKCDFCGIANEDIQTPFLLQLRQTRLALFEHCFSIESAVQW